MKSTAGLNKDLVRQRRKILQNDMKLVRHMEKVCKGLATDRLEILHPLARQACADAATHLAIARGYLMDPSFNRAAKQ